MIGLNGGLNTYNYVLQNPIINIDNLGLVSSTDTCATPQNAAACAAAGFGVGGKLAKSTSKLKPKSKSEPRTENKGIYKPDKKPGYWSCRARAECNDNIPGNCSENPKQRIAYGTATERSLGMAKVTAKFWATQNLGCQPKHVRCSCTDPKGEQYEGGCK